MSAPLSLARSAWAALVGRQFAAFVLAGGVAAAVNFGARWALNDWLGFGWAVLAAYALGMLTAFVLNRRYVFPPSGRALESEIRWFVTFNLSALPLVWAISMLLLHGLFPWLGIAWHPRELAHALAIATPVVINFFLHKHVTFARRPA